MSDRTWEDIEQEIREDYLRSDAPENVSFRKVQWEAWLSELIRKNREEAWDEAERSIHSWYKTYPETLYCAPENPYQKE